MGDPPFRSTEGYEVTTELSAGALATDPQLGIQLVRVAGESGLARPIRHPRVQKSGLALAGHYYGVVPTRVQVLGETELSFLDSLPADARGNAARGLFSLGLSCVVLTRAGEPSKSLVVAAEASGTPVFVSDAKTSRTINAIHAVLDDRLAPQTSLHGVLVDVFGVGLLLLGKSGVGKSECALELVLRGHRLVADDVVRCDWRPPGMVFGAPADMLRHHIEIRGLGILNVKALFGVTSVRDRKRIDVVVQLADWNERAEYDRLGVDAHYFHLLNTPIRELTVPVRPGRDMGSILEIAARNELLRRAGGDSAREFLGRIDGVKFEPDNEQVAPESVCPPPIDALESSTMTHLHDSDADQSAAWPARPAERPITGTESSAWMPAVRPREDDR
jgi:HPr kinase/phosphorylase